jgi:hypothetical protein
VKKKILVACLKNKVKAIFRPERFLFFSLKKWFRQGCSAHRNIEDYLGMAKKLIPFFKNILNKK